MLSRNAVLIGAILSVVVYCDAQTQHIHVHASGKTDSAQPLIDGSLQPDLISDQEAITVFWVSIMEPPAAGDAEKNRFLAKIGDMRLSDEGTTTLWSAAKNFHIQFMPLRLQAQQLAASADGSSTPFASSPALQKRAAVSASVDKLALDFYNNLLGSLSVAEAASLKTHIKLMKKQIRVVPPPHMR